MKQQFKRLAELKLSAGCALSRMCIIFPQQVHSVCKKRTHTETTDLNPLKKNYGIYVPGSGGLHFLHSKSVNGTQNSHNWRCYFANKAEGRA
jgi:hypothetical protein